MSRRLQSVHAIEMMKWKSFALEVPVLEKEHQALWLLNNIVGLEVEGEYSSNLSLLLFLHFEWAALWLRHSHR